MAMIIKDSKEVDTRLLLLNCVEKKVVDINEQDKLVNKEIKYIKSLTGQKYRK